MLLHEGLTHIQSQIKPWLLFGESFILSCILQLLSLQTRECVFDKLYVMHADCYAQNALWQQQ